MCAQLSISNCLFGETESEPDQTSLASAPAAYFILFTILCTLATSSRIHCSCGFFLNISQNTLDPSEDIASIVVK